MKQLIVFFTLSVQITFLFGQERNSMDSATCFNLNIYKFIHENKNFEKTILTYGDSIRQDMLLKTVRKFYNGEYDEETASLAIELYSKIGYDWEFTQFEKLKENGATDFKSVDEFIYRMNEIKKNFSINPENENNEENN